MLTIKLLASWFILSATIYGIVACLWAIATSGEDFSRAGANFVFLVAQGIAALCLYAVSL